MAHVLENDDGDAQPRGERAIVSICADGGQGSVALLEAQ
jgi:hypothetical protein